MIPRGRRAVVKLSEDVRLGDDFPNDPADQIIVATARCHNLTLITADERIRKWGKVRIV
jgi:PIN domain nuclease of toxin-antitoxin system